MRNFERKSDRPYRSERRTAGDGAPLRKRERRTDKTDDSSPKREFRKSTRSGSERPYQERDSSRRGFSGRGPGKREFGKSEFGSKEYGKRDFGNKEHTKRDSTRKELVKKDFSDNTTGSREFGRKEYRRGESGKGEFGNRDRYQKRDERYPKKDDRFSKRDERYPKKDDRYAKRDERFTNKDDRYAKKDERFSKKDYRYPRKERFSKKVVKKTSAKVKKGGDDGVRLNKFIANSGLCSRREADGYITAGLVSVNGEIVTTLGVKINPGDDVRFNGERLKGEQKVYIVMNKPKDFVTTTSDPHAEKTVLDLVSGRCPQRVFPVGRLDKATTGVLLLTNDGELAEKLTHPSNEKKKIYHVFLDKNLKSGDFTSILEGIELEDGSIHADALSYIDEDKSQIGLEIHSGRNRIVRRIFEHLGYKVKKLDRVYFAGLTKKNLKRGQWRFLTQDEVNFLKMGTLD